MLVVTETIMAEQRRGGHTVTRLTVHIVWVTKYRYAVLKGEIQKRCRELIIQVCDAEDGVLCITPRKGIFQNETCESRIKNKFVLFPYSSSDCMTKEPYTRSSVVS